jgi:hypothetical protein
MTDFLRISKLHQNADTLIGGFKVKQILNLIGARLSPPSAINQNESKSV